MSTDDASCTDSVIVCEGALHLEEVIKPKYGFYQIECEKPAFSLLHLVHAPDMRGFCEDPFRVRLVGGLSMSYPIGDIGDVAAVWRSCLLDFRPGKSTGEVLGMAEEGVGVTPSILCGA